MTPSNAGAEDADDDSEGTGEDDEWRYSVEDVTEDDDMDAVFGSVPPEVIEVDPGTPDPENALFVVLGVAVSLALVAALLGLV
jgi:hypothetical protein